MINYIDAYCLSWFLLALSLRTVSSTLVHRYFGGRGREVVLTATRPAGTSTEFVCQLWSYVWGEYTEVALDKSRNQISYRISSHGAVLFKLLDGTTLGDGPLQEGVLKGASVIEKSFLFESSYLPLLGPCVDTIRSLFKIGLSIPENHYIPECAGVDIVISSMDTILPPTPLIQDDVPLHVLRTVSEPMPSREPNDDTVLTCSIEDDNLRYRDICHILEVSTPASAPIPRSASTVSPTRISTPVAEDSIQFDVNGVRAANRLELGHVPSAGKAWHPLTLLPVAPLAGRRTLEGPLANDCPSQEAQPSSSGAPITHPTRFSDEDSEYWLKIGDCVVLQRGLKFQTLGPFTVKGYDATTKTCTLQQPSTLPVFGTPDKYLRKCDKRGETLWSLYQSNPKLQSLNRGDAVNVVSLSSELLQANPYQVTNLNKHGLYAVQSTINGQRLKVPRQFLTISSGPRVESGTVAIDSSLSRRVSPGDLHAGTLDNSAGSKKRRMARLLPATKRMASHSEVCSSVHASKC